MMITYDMALHKIAKSDKILEYDILEICEFLSVIFSQDIWKVREDLIFTLRVRNKLEEENKKIGDFFAK
jgi:hypothetical protein